MRAGFGIYLLLESHFQRLNLPITLNYYDDAQFYEDRAARSSHRLKMRSTDITRF